MRDCRGIVISYYIVIVHIITVGRQLSRVLQQTAVCLLVSRDREKPYYYDTIPRNRYTAILTETRFFSVLMGFEGFTSRDDGYALRSVHL